MSEAETDCYFMVGEENNEFIICTGAMTRH